ncbi:11139_t:CDS:2, partial [Funneliformis geosporum]
MSYYQEPYYNNVSADQPESYQRGYDGGGQPASNYTNPRVQENNNPYSTPNLNTRGSDSYMSSSTAVGTPRGRTDDNDSASITSSIYSQPSVTGGAPSSNMQYYQGQSFNPIEPRGQFVRNEPHLHHDDDPPSPSTNTQSSAVGLTAGSQQCYQNEKNYIPDYLEESHYQDFPPNSQVQFEVYDDSNINYQKGEPYDQHYQNHSPNSQPQLDVYNDFNNINNNYQKDEPYDSRYQDYSTNPQPQLDVYNDFNNNYQEDETYDDDGTRHNTLTGHDPNSYAMNIDNVMGTGKARHSATGDHFVVTPKKGRRCAICSRKTCVITSFIILVLLAGGMYFVWPRIPKIAILPPSPVGNPVITLNPVAAKLDMELQIEFDNRENWLPYKFKSFNVDVFNEARLSSYNRPLTTSSKKGFSIPGRAKSIIFVPISIDYSGSLPTDAIVQDFISACTQPPEGETRGVLNLSFDFKMLIWGLDWVQKPIKRVPLSDFQCPFEVTRPSASDAPADP